MASSSPSTSARERAALADLLDELGPDAPTCCEGWTTAHLAAHLVVRDRRPDAGPGYGLEALGIGRQLAAWSHKLEDDLRASTPYPELVARVRSGPPPWLPMGWPGVGELFNGSEFAIHHEDVRRAQPDWTPRDLPGAERDELWRAATFNARRIAARAPGALVLRRTDVAGTEKVLGRGEVHRTVEGDPLEVLLWTAGRRDVARVTVTGG